MLAWTPWIPSSGRSATISNDSACCEQAHKLQEAERLLSMAHAQLPLPFSTCMSSLQLHMFRVLLLSAEAAGNGRCAILHLIEQ